jgi:hypothetical protein
MLCFEKETDEAEKAACAKPAGWLATPQRTWILRDDCNIA